MPIYQLSNRQRKDLCVRNTPVLIALPSPPKDPRDLVDWARSVWNATDLADWEFTPEDGLMFQGRPAGDGIGIQKIKRVRKC